mmetsp:Transcript_3945/g.8435  ORF Transcript_3945/g.8435 Transcript_3945/m.8435 type:complete len:354 (-) Transcript_3945:444-1505(-)
MLTHTSVRPQFATVRRGGNEPALGTLNVAHPVIATIVVHFCIRRGGAHPHCRGLEFRRGQEGRKANVELRQLTRRKLHVTGNIAVASTTCTINDVSILLKLPECRAKINITLASVETVLVVILAHQSSFLGNLGLIGKLLAKILEGPALSEHTKVTHVLERDDHRCTCLTEDLVELLTGNGLTKARDVTLMRDLAKELLMHLKLRPHLFIETGRVDRAFGRGNLRRLEVLVSVLNVKSAKTLNWDTFPIVTVVIALKTLDFLRGHSLKTKLLRRSLNRLFIRVCVHRDLIILNRIGAVQSLICSKLRLRCSLSLLFLRIPVVFKVVADVEQFIRAIVIAGKGIPKGSQAHRFG